MTRKNQAVKSPEPKPGDLGHNLVTLDDALVRCSHGLTLAEKRLMMAAVSTLDSRSKRGRPGRQLVVRAADYAETFGLHPDTAYDELQKSAENLFNRRITYYERKNGRKFLTRLRWVYKIQYQQEEGEVRLAFSPDIEPYLYQLTKKFTTYRLRQASKLKSLYSWRLLELLMQYQDTGYIRISVEEFADAMEATENQRKNFNNIKRRMLEPAIKELRESDRWAIQCKPIKRGKRYAELEFHFHQDPQEQLPL